MYLILLVASMAAMTASQALNPAPPEARAETAQAGDSKQMCRNGRVMQTAPVDPQPRARRLDEMPAGHLELAVQREVDGCIEPVIIRRDFGAVAPPERR